MSHVTGSVQGVAPVITVGPDSGAPATSPNTWTHNFAHTPAASGTKLLILHFRNANLPASNRLEVDLGYGTDVFTAADGNEFWTRPVNIHVLPGGLVPIRYITDGAMNGGVVIDKYGRGERHEEDPELATNPDFQSLSNCDPFLPGSSYLEPDYATFWFCGATPNWENVKCVVPPGDVRNSVSAAVGMIVSVHGNLVSSCSVTLIDTNRVITAGHCVADPAEEIFTSSVTFDYMTQCNGSKPPGYNAKFHKVKKLIRFRNKTVSGLYHDYCVLELAVPGGGLGITPLTMRTDLPALGEQVFGVHHPNGAVKKLSIPHPGFATVTSSSAGAIGVNLDVSGGSSGSGLFDASGRIVGVLSNGGPCSLNYFPTATIIPDLSVMDPPATRDVMIVFDRSGSMSLDAGTGRTKIEEARDAASLFVQLVRAATGNRVGLVSFSTTASAPVDFALADATSANKTMLVGPAPFSGGIVGGLAANGLTTIGGGLEGARLQFPAPGTNPRTILLLTDGMQNTPPMVAMVEPGLAGIDINVIGYGTESSLDGTLLTQLASSHNGLYTRAASPLHLKKFFALAFGNIFEAGAAVDPEYTLSEGQKEAKPVPFDVCGEESLVVVVGWDQVDTRRLDVRLRSPLGAIIEGTSPGAEQSTGRTWTFLRVPLPHDGERDGVWNFQVFRAGGGTVNYFVNVIVRGGPRLDLMPLKRKIYTGDVLNPLVALKYNDGTFPHGAKVKVTVSVPNAAVGNILTNSGLRPPRTVNSDTIPSRQATLLGLEEGSRGPVVGYTERTFDLFDDAAHGDGTFEKDGVFGNPLKDLLTVEGNYTFHFQATYGEDCIGTRELFWTLHADVAVDPSRTGVKVTETGRRADGSRDVRIDLVPRDPFGNHLGPGRLDAIALTGSQGTVLTGAVKDNGDGSYTVVGVWDPSAGQPPGVVIGQPDRQPIVVHERQPIANDECRKWKVLFWLSLSLLLILSVLLLVVWLR